MDLALVDNIEIERILRTPIEKQRIEIVERKGLGHPDSICDAVMNYGAVELFKVYVKKFGERHFPHFNLDKALLAAGEAEHRFGGGVVKKPMLFILGDRATTKIEDVEIPVSDIVIDAAKRWLKQNLRYIEPEHVAFQNEIKPGSTALSDIFRRPGSTLGANDTSAAVGYAPLTKTEQTVLDLERYINSVAFHKQFPASGEDVKVMAVRKGNNIVLTVALAMVDRFVESEKAYFRIKDEIKENLLEKMKSNLSFDDVKLYINTLDIRGRGVNGVYLTIAGTSADCADSGEVGRGNKPNGVISMLRSGGVEAAAGKNPTSHVGKIYNLLAQKIANRIYTEVVGVVEVDVHIVSQIGRPINEPCILNPKLVLDKDVELSSVKNQVKEILLDEFDRINNFCRELARGEIPIC